MERTEKQKKLVIIQLATFLILLLIVLGVFFVYLLPKIKEIEALKSTTQSLSEDVRRIERWGMTYNEFKALIESGNLVITSNGEQSEEYVQELVNNVTEGFFERNLVNVDSPNYKAFLEEQAALIDEGLPIEKKNEIISAVLPIYSEFVSDLGDGTLSEFKFVNYIESIMETFRLSHNNQIGIQNVTLVEGYSIGLLDSTLESNIYFIPVSLDLTGRRADILDFLYFAERVGRVTIDGNNIYIDEEVSADFRSSFPRGKLLRGQTTGTSIFANQLFSIESISFPEYLDPDISYSERYKNALSLVSYIKSTTFPNDGNFKVNVKLRFFVKGLPVYKVQNYIREFIQNVNQLNSNISRTLSNNNITSTERQKLIDLQMIMEQFGRTVLPNIQQGLQLRNINEGYNLVNRYFPTLREYKAIVDTIMGGL